MRLMPRGRTLRDAAQMASRTPARGSRRRAALARTRPAHAHHGPTRRPPAGTTRSPRRTRQAGDHHRPRRRQGQALGADLRLCRQHEGVRPSIAAPRSSRTTAPSFPTCSSCSAGTRVTFPNADPFLHNVFSPIADAAVRPRQLQARREGRHGRLFHAGGRRGAVQHAREDARERPGRSQPPLREGERRRQLPAGKRPGRRATAGRVDARRQAGDRIRDAHARRAPT